MSKEKLRIGVLMGGKSIEREVSFNSGRTICDHLDTQRYDVVPLFQTERGELYRLPQHFLHRGKIADFAHRLAGEAEKITWDRLKKKIDFMYITLHGRYGEDGTLQGMLEVLGIPYLGAKVLGSALGMNKVMQKSVLQAHGIDVARGITVTPPDIETITTPNIMQRLTAAHVMLPVIIKPAHEGSSLGISVVHHEDELIKAIHDASSVDPQRSQDVIIEEYLSGMEFVCVALERVTRHNGESNKTWFAFPITEIVIEADRKLFDYEQKYMPGRALKITPARCSAHDQKRIQDACIAASAALNFSTISRIDGFLTRDGRVVLIDPNSLTGMAPSTFLFHQAAEAGMSHTALINFLIEQELIAYGLIDDKTAFSLEKGETMAHSNHSKLRIAVLLGGDSNERETSLESGRNVCYKLSPDKYDVTPLFVNDHMELFAIPHNILIKNATRAIAPIVTPDMQMQWSDLPEHFDFVFIGLHGGKGENGAVQGTLEMLDMPYNGPDVLTSALCMDKYKTNNFLRTQGFAVPNNFLLSKEAFVAGDTASQHTLLESLLHTNAITFPAIIKPHDDGCSVMVSKANSIDELCQTLMTYFASSKSYALIEEMIIGVELTVGVLGNHDAIIALPPSMSVAKGGILSMEEKFLPGAGENQTPAPLPTAVLDLIQKTIVAVFKAVGGTGYSRIDCFYQTAAQSPTGNERVVILEINTLPALTPATCLFHQAAEVGIKPMELIDKIVELGLERHRQQHAGKKPTHTLAARCDEEIILQSPSSKRDKVQEKISCQPPADVLTMKLF